MLGDHMITVSTTANDDKTTKTSTRHADRLRRGPADGIYDLLTPTTSSWVAAPCSRCRHGRERWRPHTSSPWTADDVHENDTVERRRPDIAQSLVRGSMELTPAFSRWTQTPAWAASPSTRLPTQTAGSTARIFVSAGDVEITHTVTFGDPDAMPPTDPMDEGCSPRMYTVTADLPRAPAWWKSAGQGPRLSPSVLVMRWMTKDMVAAWDVALHRAWQFCAV